MTQMKDSGVDWIGRIPADWQICKAKNIFQNSKRLVGEKHVETERLALTLGGVIKRDKEANDGLQPNDFSGYQYLLENELVFKLIDLENVQTSRVGLSPYNGMVSPAYIILKNKSKDNRFYYYYFLSMWQREVFNHLGDEGVRSSLNAQDLLNIPILNPKNKHNIANFLDEKCGQIDKLIEIQEKEIDKLKEYRTSVITKAVTKGLDETVPMKDSGIDWMGQIPSHWKINKLKFVSKLITDGTHQTPNYIDQGIPFLSIKDISSGKINFEDAKYISQEEHELLCKHAPIEKGDLIFTRIGTLGVFVLVDTDKIFDIFVSVGLVKFKDDISSLQKKYIMYFLSSSSFLDYINLVKAGGGTSAAKFNLEDVRESVFTMPEAIEMKTILQFLDSKCSKIDNIIEKKNQKIEKLKEYKKSLIYEYVTGKKQVND